MTVSVPDSSDAVEYAYENIALNRTRAGWWRIGLVRVGDDVRGRPQDGVEYVYENNT